MSSLFHTYNCNNKLLVLGEGPTYGVNRNFGVPEKKFIINFSKARTKFAWVCITIVIMVIC